MTRLYEVFAPARILSSFVVVNAGILTGNNVFRDDSRRPGRHPGLVWLSAVLELCNGVGHLALALYRGGYFPGAATSPFLICFASWVGLCPCVSKVSA